MTSAGPLPDGDDVPMTVEEAVATAGFSCPSVSDERSLRTAIRYAEDHPGARVFAVKGAYRLGLADLLPAWPETAGTVVHVGRTSAVVTAGGQLAGQRTGAPVGIPPPSRRVRRQQRGVRAITDGADLLAAIRRNPSDPAERQRLVDIAVEGDRLRWVPEDWPEHPARAVSLAPGAAEALQRAAYGQTSAETTQVSRDRTRGAQ